jgi:glycerophosphoryl diester phosphodiesterase
MKKIFVYGAAFLLATMTVFADTNTTSNTRPMIYGHRGARGLAPENTIPAYAKALQIGVDYLDMDVGMTKDGVIVVSHELSLDPDLTRDSKGQWIPDDKEHRIWIKDLTWKELETYDVGRLKPGTAYAKQFPDQQPVDGTHIPSLKQVIEFAKKNAGDNIKFQIEIKTDPTQPNATYSPEKVAKAVVKILKDEGVDSRVDLQSFDWRALFWIQKLDKNIATAYLTRDDFLKTKKGKQFMAGFSVKDFDNLLPKIIATLGGKVWGPDDRQLTKQNVELAHQYGLRVVAWTVNDKSAINKMLKLKIDGIIGDRPDLIKKTFEEKGLAIPAGVSQVKY